MKELAIRIWSYSKKKWILPIPTVAGDPPILFSFSTDKNPVTYIGFNKNFVGFEDYEIVRYTGLKDKNGTKIFEGDIVEFNQHATYEKIKANVFFINCAFTVHYHPNKTIETWNNLPLNEEDQDTMEIIGSIYENPELLEQL